MLISIALVSGGLLLWPVVQGAATAGLSPAAAVLLMNREKAVVVDVCETGEFAAGHIVGSKNVPLGELEAKLGAAVKNKTLPLILVCQTGARSGHCPEVGLRAGAKPGGRPERLEGRQPARRKGLSALAERTLCKP